MSLSLKFGGQLLVETGSGSAVAVLENGISVSVSTRILIARGRQRKPYSPVPRPRDNFTTTIGDLPEDVQALIREDINKQQKEIHDHAPSYKMERRRGGLLPPTDAYGRSLVKPRPLRRIPFEKPPATIEIADTYRLAIQSHSTHNYQSCLEVGKALKVSAQRPFHFHEYNIGVIASFTLI